MLEAIELCQKISGKELDYPDRTEARVGDHQWWISDLSELERDYPGWQLTLGIEDVLREIHDANVGRWVAGPQDGSEDRGGSVRSR